MGARDWLRGEGVRLPRNQTTKKQKPGDGAPVGSAPEMARSCREASGMLRRALASRSSEAAIISTRVSLPRGSIPPSPASSSSSSSSREGRRPRFFSTTTTCAERPVDDDEWETVVGLELHVQIGAKTKLFSGWVRASLDGPARTLATSPRPRTPPGRDDDAFISGNPKPNNAPPTPRSRPSHPGPRDCTAPRRTRTSPRSMRRSPDPSPP